MKDQYRRPLIVLSGLGLLLSAACGPARSADAPAPSASPAAPAFAQVTPDEAKSVLDAYVVVNNKVNANRDVQGLAAYEGGASLDADKGALAGDRLLNPKKSSINEFVYTGATFFVPAVSAYPRWIVARAHGSTKGKQPDVAWSYLLFRQAEQGAPWLQVASPKGNDADSDPPAVRTGDGGLATVVALDAADVVVPPSKVASLYAQRLNNGALDRFAGADGWVDWVAREKGSSLSTVKATIAAAPSYPDFALAAADGGALVFTTVTISMRYDIHKNSWMTYNGSGYLKGRYTQYMQTKYILEALVYVPPASGTGKQLRVLGTYGEMITGSGK
ncbi:MAG: hypothetical protein HOV66_26040 [Streptomycetaceae bacterium]|nr:hypothetical protein [Streptomycetaceae bacterium]